MQVHWRVVSVWCTTGVGRLPYAARGNIWQPTRTGISHCRGPKEKTVDSAPRIRPPRVRPPRIAPPTDSVPHGFGPGRFQIQFFWLPRVQQHYLLMQPCFFCFPDTFPLSKIQNIRNLTVATSHHFDHISDKFLTTPVGENCEHAFSLCKGDFFIKSHKH